MLVEPSKEFRPPRYVQGAPLLFTPGLGGLTGLPSLLVSAWLVRNFAGKPLRSAIRVES